MSPSQPESGSNDGLPTYVQMLVGFEAVPEWHNLLSTYFILQLTTGFITIPPAFVTLSTDGTSFRLTLNKPLYVQFHFTAFIPPRFYNKKILVLQISLFPPFFSFNFGVDVDQSPGSRTASG
jgi:hypothetical protein